MINEELKRIRKIAMLCQTGMPRGLQLMDAMNPQTPEEWIIFLNQLYQDEELSIEEELANKSVFLNDHEKEIREFSRCLWGILFPIHHEIRGIEGYSTLLRHRHVAEAFYAKEDMLNEDSLFSLEQKIAFYKDEEIIGSLYLGLVDFYLNYSGKLNNDESPIRLLCINYPIHIKNINIHTDSIVEALFIYARRAGTSEDIGYDVNGISQIQQYICKLPDNLINMLVGKYSLNDLVNSSVYQRQIYTIIKYSGMKQQIKDKMKFFFMDSLMIANQISIFFTQIMREREEELEENYLPYNITIADKEISVLKRPESGWISFISQKKRIFKIKHRTELQIILEHGNSVISSNGGQIPSQKLPFQNDNWQMNIYQTKENEEVLYRIATGIIGQSQKLVYNQMLFSFLYLNNYRGMKEQIFNFDHRYSYQIHERQIKHVVSTKSIPCFYGDFIYSLSCIVGRNGKGKTSAVDFLRETFFILLRIIHEYNKIYCENGCIRLEEDDEVKKINETLGIENSEFLVVFRLGQKDYFLTNIEGVTAERINPYEKGSYTSINEFSKIVYFSQQIRSDQRELFRERSNNDSYNWVSALKGFRQYNYSEAESLARNITHHPTVKQENLNSNEMSLAKRSVTINKELCYQIAFLRHVPLRKFRKLLDINEGSEICIYDTYTGKTIEKISLERLDREEIDWKKLEKTYIFKSGIQMGFFSSGQYVKFMFLAKLHWFLTADQADIEHFQKLIADYGSDIEVENPFSKNEFLLNKETALIFIDEGEVYYHPEWQRCYIATLLEMLATVKEKGRIQVILTTNSPFIISDILAEDVIYLSHREKICNEKTFGQNIHTLLKDAFFMDYTIGEYSKKIIDSIMQWIESGKKGEEKRQKEIAYYFGERKDDYWAINLMINQIGEPIYRDTLRSMLIENSYFQEDEINRKIETLEAEMLRLREKKRYD